MSDGSMRIVLDYAEKRREFERFLSSTEGGTMVLATSHQHRVMARTILVANRGIELYFITWRHSRKCPQIAGNPRVALCKDRFQIEGTAQILGSVSDPRHRPYVDLLRERFPEAVARWMRLPNTVLVKVHPTLVTVASHAGRDPTIEFLDLETHTAYAERWANY